MILVAGGTGKLGRELLPRLVERGHAVRVLTRDASRPAPPGIELVAGDVRDPEALARAVRGCSIVVSAVHGFAGPGKPSPEVIDRDANVALIAAAKGVARFVLVSVHGAAADHPMSLHRAKFAAEEALRASGLAHAIVRPTAFMETWTEIIGSTVARKGHALVFGPGTNPINFVSVRDVAALVAIAVDDESLRDRVVELGGPENLGFAVVAERLLAARGAPARVKHIPLPVLRVMAVLARPFSPGFARKAGAAVVMNTRDGFSLSETVRERYPQVPRTSLDDVLRAG